MTTLIREVYTQYQDLDGQPLENGYIYIGVANENPETSPISVYSDVALTQPLAQPLRTLNGYVYRSGTPTDVYVAQDTYSINVRNQQGELVVTKASSSTEPSADVQWVDGPEPTFVNSTSFTLVGNQTGEFQIGRRVKTINTADTIYSTITNSVFGALTTVTVANDSGVLDSGLSAVFYGILSPIHHSIPGFQAAGDFITQNTPGTIIRFPAVATVATHATTMNLFVAREVTLSGSAVTVTDIADAPYIGAVVWVKNAQANIWTDGAVFSIQGNRNFTAESGDWLRITAVTLSTFDILVFRNDSAGNGLVLIEAQYAPNPTDFTFITGIDSKYDEYLFVLSNIIPLSDAGSLVLSVSRDGGANWDGGAGNYSHIRSAIFSSTIGAMSSAGSASDTSILLAGSVGTSTGENLNGEVRLFHPSSAATYPTFGFNMSYVASDASSANVVGSGSRLLNAAINGVKFGYAGGQLVSGTACMYGVRKS